MAEPGIDVRIVDDVVGSGDRLVIIVGNYGSGKTEVCVNLAIAMTRAGWAVQIADLDLVNPYFRCREVQWRMEGYGIRVVYPPGPQAWADLPILLPEIRGMLRPPHDTLTIFDVGGDDVGARVLATLRKSITSYELWQVINAKRPFTETVDGCIKIQEEIERASRLRVTGLVANSHLIDRTTADVVVEGWRLANDVSRQTGIPLRCVALMDGLADAPEINGLDAPLLRMRRYMTPPWIRPEPADILPSALPRPIGKPGPIRIGVPAKENDGKD